VTITITAMGEVPSSVALYRAGARPGDDIWVSGDLGGAALGLGHPEIAEAATRLHEPEPRVELGERLRGLANAAIDVSDGLAGDLGHILERSRLGAVVEYERIPKSAAFAKLEDAQLERGLRALRRRRLRARLHRGDGAARRPRSALARARPRADAHRLDPGRRRAPHRARRQGQADEGQAGL
jgi:hypothetical protein